MTWKAVLLSIAVCSHLFAADLSIDQRVNSKIRGFPGKVTLFAKNMDSGAIYAISPDEPVRTASTIKLAVMVECFFEASEGKLQWTEPLKLTTDEKVSGTGILQDLSDGDQLPLRDMVDLMIVLSDNTATNLILNRIGGNAVNARMQMLGLSQTRLMRKILGSGSQASGVTNEGEKPENKRWGTGRSSPREMVTILEKLYRGELVNKEACDEMIAILKRQRDHDGIGRDMTEVTIASKSGALDHLRSDVGIVYSKGGAIAMAITVEDIPDINYTADNPGNLLISSLSETLVDELGRKSGQP